MTNSEIEKRANAMLAKYVQRGGVHKVWDKIMTGENIKYRQITTSPNFVGALTRGNNGQSYIMTNAAISNDGRRNFTIAHELGHYALEHKLQQESYKDKSDVRKYSMTGYLNCVLEDKQALLGMKIV